MLISRLNILPCCLVLLSFSVICKAQDDSAPAKFYDGLLFESEKTQQPFTDQDEENTSDLTTKTTAILDKKTVPQNKSAANAQLQLSSNTNADEFDIYVVGKNETLYSIALRFKVSVKQLSAWNAITSAKQVYLGQKLKIFKNKQKHSDLNSLKKPAKIIEISSENSEKTSIISINNKSMLKFYCHWPTKGKIIKNFSQTGNRGIEISGKIGQSIKATATGKVVAVSHGIYGHGGFIVIEHADLILSSYANNSRALVQNGQLVAEGQMIAEMGRVGRKPPSLEFEIRKNGILVNPMRCLPKKT